ncbi:MAG TPA: sulfotransferase [Gemmatimonadota bacterium]|nr:sulfotransferase [Gemmatimonadota bacterium]
MPNFLVIGAARSGTTSLHSYLGSHPEIYMSPVKEPNFFAQEGGHFDFGDSAPGRRIRTRLSILDSEKYHALFRGVTDEKAIGEASPSYMGSPRAAGRIQQAIPGARLIAILRHPAERAYANYMGRLRDGRERNLDPLEAIGGALSGRGPRWRSEVYIDQGFYHARLQPFYERFDRERIRVCLFDDFVRDTDAVLRDLFSFLGVDPEFEPDTSVVHNSTGWIPNPLLRVVWTNAKPIGARLGTRLPRPIHAAAWRLVRRNLTRPPLPTDLRVALIERYRPDVLELERLLGRDLSDWLV